MNSYKLTFKLMLKSMLSVIFTLCLISVVQAGPLPAPFLQREMFSRGAIRGQQYRERSKIRQMRVQNTRMPQDVRERATLPMDSPGESRPEIVDAINRDHTKFIAGGWMWNSGAVPLYSYKTGPIKGFSDPMGDMVEYAGTDPEGIAIAKETPITEWWEFSARESRAEFFRTRFGAAQQMQATPRTDSVGMREIDQGMISR